MRALHQTALRLRSTGALAIAAALALTGCGGADDDDEPSGDAAAGATLYKEMCASCHGAAGEGGFGTRLNPWTRGRQELVDLIDSTMPKADPSLCEGECAEDVASFILSWPSACDKSARPARGLRLLNRREYNNTVSDLFKRSHSGACASDGDCNITSESCVAGACVQDPCNLHTFVYDAGNRQVRSVHVAGSFNGWPQTIAGGGWALEQLPGSNRWATKRSIPEGSYEYKLLLDESEWITDPTNPRTIGNDRNSALSISCQSGGGAPAPSGVGAVTDPSRDFPAESRPTGYAFDNNAEAGLVTAVHVEQYMKAAESLASEAVRDLGSVVPCDPASDRNACAQEFARSFGARAFRRPLTDEEANKYAGLVTAQSDFKVGVSVAIQVMLSSPYFLYRFEIGAPQADGSSRLTPHEVAGALSYMFWGTMPDGALFESAASGKLSTKEGIATEARRLLADPRSHAVLQTFAIQWLGIEKISTVTKSEALFPEFTADVRRSLIAETSRFITHVVFDSTHKYDELLLADYTFADQTLAPLYGLQGLGADLEQVKSPAERSAGLLGHASVLAAYSYPDQSSPILRGLFVRRNLLCQAFPEPPANAATIPAIDPNATTRERFRQHSSDQSCHSCHQYIDDLGFGFEHFDAIGRYRETENGKPIDAAGDMNDVEALGTGTHAPFSSLPELGATLAKSGNAKACFARQTYRFAAGHIEAPADLCALDELSARFEQSGYDIQELLVAITQLDGFTTRK
jgi:Protein of unknown function (DUF1592)/Protein of unknown function (DUF1588)/Protein of unknown function (DUF1595)/Protein of unknown function (DUF1585)/Protein of unknown function (DUF1587)/Cytochrome C oxidase, cbb3-type, subunit III